METNISWLFYKNYFEGLDFSQPNSNNNVKRLKKKNREITESELYVIGNSLATHSIPMVVQYPGLVTGVGINHEANVEGEFKLGVHFDYTYGMPVIYGSSVKGLLRSAFPEEKNKNSEKERKLRADKINLIKKYLGIGFENINVDFLRDQIFEGKKRGYNTIERKKESKSISIYERDIFFDAVIIKSAEKNKILTSDSITPHQKQGVLNSPVPITFLKIASGVKLEFRFDLKDAVIEGLGVTAEKKKELFNQILLDFGIGAKTNVGYGQFSKV